MRRTNLDVDWSLKGNEHPIFRVGKVFASYDEEYANNFYLVKDVEVMKSGEVDIVFVTLRKTDIGMNLTPDRLGKEIHVRGDEQELPFVGLQGFRYHIDERRRNEYLKRECFIKY